MQPEVYEAALRRRTTVTSTLAGRRPQRYIQKAELPKLDTSIALWLILFVFGGGLLSPCTTLRSAISLRSPGRTP
jgi:hypothetical protein